MADPKPPLGEFGRIERYLSPLSRGVAGAWNLGDDAAWLPHEAMSESVPLADETGWIISTDTMVEGVHFFSTDTPDDMARRLLRVNLSDMAAMGAYPRVYFLNLALPSSCDDLWFSAFAQGLQDDQERFGLGLAGGDCVSVDGPVIVSATILGCAAHPIRRSGARAGDYAVVSGRLGDASLSLEIHRGRLSMPPDDAAALDARRRLPEPRVKLGQALAGRVHAAIDISDGLVADLRHICEQSGVGASIKANTIPLSPVARRALDRDASLLDIILTGGDDYELLFACPPQVWPKLADRTGNVPLTRIGMFKSDSGISILDSQGAEKTLPREGYQHGPGSF